MAPIPAPLAVSIGDPAGIGPEIIAGAWEQRVAAGLPPFLAIGNARSIRAFWDGPIAVLSDPASAAAAFDGALPLIQVDDPGEIVPGEPNLAGARCALDSLELAAGIADPIHQRDVLARYYRQFHRSDAASAIEWLQGEWTRLPAPAQQSLAREQQKLVERSNRTAG